MRIYSELTGKNYNTVQECERAEAQFKKEEIAQKEQEKKKQQEISKQKKELAKQIEDAEKKVSELNDVYKTTLQQANAIVEQAKKQASVLIDEATNNLKQANIEKANLICKFNEEFGAYTKVYSNLKTTKEIEDLLNTFENLNNTFMSRIFNNFLF